MNSYVSLAEVHRALADTRVARRTLWFETFQHHIARYPDDSATATRLHCDAAVVHLDNEIDRLEGERDALTAEIRGLENAG